MKLKTCKYCGVQFGDYPSHIGRRSYCSWKCFNSGRITARTKRCMVCNNLYTVNISQEKWRGESRYCSRACQYVGANKRKPIVCRHCGKTTFRGGIASNDMRRGKFCNQVCHLAWRKEQRTFTRNCDECGEQYTRCVASIAKTKGKIGFCSRKCSVAYRVGKNHHAFREGFSPMRGRKWKAISKEIILRDGRKCLRCGVTECDLPPHQNLHVDHTMPARLFGRDLKQMNDPSNLKTLCMSCHGLKTTKYEPRMLKGDAFALQEFYKLDPNDARKLGLLK